MRPSTAWFVAVPLALAVCLSAASAVATSAKPTAAVLPTVGSSDLLETKLVTIEVRNRLREYGFRLVRQKQVRRARDAAEFTDPATAKQMIDIGVALDAALVVAPELIVPEEGGLVQIELRGVRIPGPVLEPVAAVLSLKGEVQTMRQAAWRAVSECLESWLGPAPEPAPKLPPPPVVADRPPVPVPTPPPAALPDERIQVEAALGVKSLRGEYREYRLDALPGQAFAQYMYDGFRTKRAGGVVMIVTGAIFMAGAFVFGFVDGIEGGIISGEPTHWFWIGAGCNVVGLALLIPGIVLNSVGKNGQRKLRHLIDPRLR
jgi:hypothetical protein